MTWRNCQASMTLVNEINKRWPGRDKASDGTIGDAAHATRTSDHNPWYVLAGVGIVRARDVDKDGVDAAWLVEYLRTLGAKRDPRLYPGGYVIFNRRITDADFSGWHTYTGSNPHDHHFHVSFSTVPAGFDSAAPWGIATAAPTIPATEDDMTPEQAQQLNLLVTQLVTGPDPAKSWGWPTFGGGTNEKLTVVDYLRRTNQQVAALAAQVKALETGKTPIAGPGSLTDVDVQRVAAAVVKLLGAKTSA